MSTVSYYYYDSTYPSSYPGSSYTSYTYTTAYPTSYYQVGVDGSECLNYVYLVWVYFLFYIGAGYPSYYYPYIIATLLDTVPQECGGTAGENTGSGLDNSALSLLSLQQSYPFGGGGTGGVQIALSPGQSYAGYGTSGSGTNSLAAYGIQQPQVVVPQGYTNYGIQGALGGLGRRRREVSGKTLQKMQMRKKYQKIRIIKDSKERKQKKTVSNINNFSQKESRTLKREEERQDAKKKARKDKQKENEAKSRASKKKDKQRSIIELRALERKEQRQSDNIKQRKENRQQAREKKQEKNIAKRIKERKQERLKTKKGERQQRKKKRKEKRKKARKRKSLKIENSVLGRSIPKGRLQDFKKKFVRGKIKTKGFASFKFLNNLDFPYSRSGALRRDFRKLVKKRVINKLPDYCEEAKIEKSKKVKADCQKRAKRIKERILERLTKKKSSVPLPKQNNSRKKSQKEKKMLQKGTGKT